MVRTRFAPSPTGSLHVGNARIAVLNWLFARHHDGSFVLRIEDTDEARTVPGAESELLDDLLWLGLDWAEGPGVEGPDEEGPFGPYRQSERGGLYRDHVERLVEAGHAFRCYCSAEELERKRQAAIARGEPPHYDGACRGLTDGEAARMEREGRTPAVRFRVPDDGMVVVHDVVRGEVTFDAAELGDFIILRSDGLPTYNLAVVVDDALMRITHVIRGAGHLSNTPRQVLLYRALGHEPPVFAHAPMVLGPDRRKLSKRHGATAVTEYRRRGYHPDAVLNYLSLLGWSSPSGDEFLLRSRLINEISLDRIGAADVVFDEQKLRWLSSKHIARLPIETLAERVEAFVDRERHPISDEALPAALDAVRSHLSSYAEVNDHLEPFVPTLDGAGAAARDRMKADADAQAVIREVRRALAALESWEQEAIDAAVRSAGGTVGARGRSLFTPLRTALTGREHGPPLAAVVYVQGRQAVLHLLDAAMPDPDGV